MRDCPGVYRIIEYPEYDLVVPFICHRCGNCCRKYDPIVDVDLLPEIAGIMNQSIHAIQARLNDTLDAHQDGVPSDCCFLDPLSNDCLIQAVKPESCRHFPSLTDDSCIGNVDCRGYREYKAIIEEFLKRHEPARIRAASYGKKPRPIPAREKTPLLEQLKNTKASKTFTRIFMMMNKM